MWMNPDILIVGEGAGLGRSLLLRGHGFRAKTLS